MLPIEHYSIDDPKSRFIAPNQMQAAAYSWNCIFVMISEAFQFYHDQYSDWHWRENVRNLHSALSSIEDNICDYNFAGMIECDACDFANSINALVQFGILDKHERYFIRYSDDSMEHARQRRCTDLRPYFIDPFHESFRAQREYLQVKMQPKDYSDAIQYFGRAHLRIQWLKGVMENVDLGHFVSYNYLPAPPEFHINNGQQQQQIAYSNSNAQVAIEKDAVKAESRIESGAVKMEANPTIHVAAPDMKPIADLFAPLMARLAEPEKRTADRPEKDSPIDSGDAPLPPLDSRVSRADLAAKLGKGTETLQGWERKGQAPGGVVWPKAEVTANNAYYNFREAWQSLLSLLPDMDRTRKAILIEELSIMKRP